MTYLLLAIFFSTSTALILKYSESNKLNRNIVTSVNYVIASIFSLVILLSVNIEFSLENLNLDLLLPIFNDHENTALSDQGSLLWSLIIGVVTGILYYLGFILIQVSIKRNGVGLTGAFSKLGIFIPIVFSIVIWNEIPDSIKIVGIILTITSIFIINKPEKDKSFFQNFNLLLILVLFVVGAGDFANKIFEKYANIEYKTLFLLILFSSALISSLFFTLRDLIIRKYKITFKDILIGLLVGIPNLFTSYFLIESFAYYDTGVVFSIFSAGTILMITLGAVTIFKEKLSQREYFGIGVIILALTLLNI